MRRIATFALMTLALAVGTLTRARAQVDVLTFEGLGNLESVDSFYNGGFGGNGSGPGPNYGITFSSSSLALISNDAGGSGNFDSSALPSGHTALFFLSGTDTMDVPAGFQNGFSFFYSAINTPGAVSVWSGPDETGSLLATLTLPVTPSNPPGRFEPFVPVGVTFAGTAESVDFGGTANQIVFDDITLGSATADGATPEPGTVTMLLSGLLIAAPIARRRLRRK